MPSLGLRVNTKSVQRLGNQTTQRVFQNISLSRLEFGFGCLIRAIRGSSPSIHKPMHPK